MLKLIKNVLSLLVNLFRIFTDFPNTSLKRLFVEMQGGSKMGTNGLLI